VFLRVFHSGAVYLSCPEIKVIKQVPVYYNLSHRISEHIPVHKVNRVAPMIFSMPTEARKAHPNITPRNL